MYRVRYAACLNDSRGAFIITKKPMRISTMQKLMGPDAVIRKACGSTYECIEALSGNGEREYTEFGDPPRKRTL